MSLVCCIFRLTERFNQTLITHLLRVVNTSTDNWDEMLESILFAYRINPQKSTKISPFELMYGVKARLPVDLTSEVESEDTTDLQRINRIESFTSEIETLRGAARDNLVEAQKQQKKSYDLKHAPPTYKIGDKVLKYNRRREGRMGDKLAPRYTGPYTITELLERGVYRLKDGEKMLKQSVNATNIKLWHEQSPRVPQSPELSPSNSTRSVSTSATQRWCLRDLNLTVVEEGLINDGGWLNDRLMDAINKLVARTLGLDASQTTLLAQTEGGFDEASFETIQILHDNDHWIATSCVGGTVSIADSMSRPISDYVSKQLKTLYASCLKANGDLDVICVPACQQDNGADCGVYAAAFVFEWALLSADVNVSFDRKLMRKHLALCLEKGEVRPFPRHRVSTRNLKHKVRQAVTVTI